MTESSDNTESSDASLDANQLAVFETSLHLGSAEASAALAKWIGKASVVAIDALEQLPLQDAAQLLSWGDDPICFCFTEMRGALTGEMILAFDDSSGWALADLLLDKPAGSTTEWTELATSAALETTNILCCSYLNSLSRICGRRGSPVEMLPGPPSFNRDFAESLLEFALMGQAIASDQVLLSRTRFEIDGTPLNWTLLFVPDAPSMQRLPALLPEREAEN